MKYLLLVAILIPETCLSQKTPLDTAQFYYSGVQVVDSSTPSKVLQSRARVFVTENFKSAKDVIQMDDQDAGVIIVKGNFVPVITMGMFGKTQYGWVNFMLKLQFKDGRYKYTFSDFNHEGNGNNIRDGGALANYKPVCGTFYMTMGYWRQIKTWADTEERSLVARIQSAMTDQSISTKKDSF